ncbi:MAG: glycosyltransferase [Thiohalomonadaceae bacterium]
MHWARVYVVEEQPNPSADFFVMPALRGRAGAIVRCGFAELPSPEEADGAAVVFVRYVPRAWRAWVESVRERLAGVVCFMDDDLLDPQAWSGLPLRYRFKLWRLTTSQQQWLQRMRAQLWVSTAWLKEKYARWQPRLILPVPLDAGADDLRRVFYHGSASHEAEVRWLRPVVEEALNRDERLVFEIVGGSDVYRLYRGLPRVNVVHPMKWPAYQAFLATPGRHVGLAPLMASRFNRARSYTKFFDITHCGAAGIYAAGSACGDVVRAGLDGEVLPMDEARWVEAILALARDDARRLAMVQNARERVQALAHTARELS